MTISRSMRTSLAMASVFLTASVVALTALALYQQSAVHDLLQKQAQTIQARLSLSGPR